MFAAGPIIQYGSYKICLYAMGGAFVLQFILTFFLMPETAFKREGVVNIDTTAQNVRSLLICSPHRR